MTATPKSIARDVMLQHVFCFPDDMDGERCEIERRFDVSEGGVVVASFQRLEFEIVQAIERGLTAEREACAQLVHDRLGADGYGVAQLIRARNEPQGDARPMTETPDTLPERLRHTHPEAAEHIALLRRTLHAIVEMIDDCPDAPRGSDSLPGAIRFYADGALRGIDTGVK